MKQVVFAVLLLAMASFTGCLTDDESSVDENTETIDDSTSDTTEENSDTTEETKDDELIDPVGTDGITIPKDSSVFMDGSYYQQYMGSYECSNPRGENPNTNMEGYADDEEDYTCSYFYYENDHFRSIYNQGGDFTGITYNDADGQGNAASYYGWINKTDSTVTIETLVYPDRGFTHEERCCYNLNGSNERVSYYSKMVDKPVNNNCYTSQCEVIFFGVNNLEYNAVFNSGTQMGSEEFAIDTDNDGQKDAMKYIRYYQRHTMTFDLPFEPFGFSLISSDGKVDRIF